MFFDEDQGSLIRIVGEGDFTSESCGMQCGECDPIGGFMFARYVGAQTLMPAGEYAGQIICHGQRDATTEESTMLENSARPSARVCDIEIQYIRD